jgi:hypothetical protein
MLYSEHETVAPTALENSSIRIPSAASCYDDDNDEDTISVSEDVSEKPYFAQYSTDPVVLEENGDTESTNLRFSGMIPTSSPGFFSLLSRGDEGSGYEVETKDDSDISTKAALENTKLPKQDITKPAEQDSKTTTQDTRTAKKKIKSEKKDMKPAKQDVKPAKQDMKPAKQDMKPAKQDIKFAKQDAKPAKQDMKPAKHDMIPAKQDVKPAKEDNSLDSEVIELQISEVSPTNFQTYQTLNNDVNQEQVLSDESNIIESQDTDLSNGGQREINNGIRIPSIVLSSEGNPSSKDDREVDATAKEIEESLSSGSDDDDSVAGLPIEDDDIETKARGTEELSEANHQKDVTDITEPQRDITEPQKDITESQQVDGVSESKEIPVTNSDTVDLTETSKSLRSDVVEVQKISETTLNTDDSEIHVREIQLLSQRNLKTDERSEKAENQHSSKVRSFSGDTNFQTNKIHENAQIPSVVQSSKLTSESRDKSRPIKGQELEDNGLADTQKMKSQSNTRKDSVSSEKNSERKINDNLREKSKLDEKSTRKEEGKGAKAEKPKGNKLDIQGVGKADNKTTEAKDKMETNAQNKVDLSDLFAKKSSNKTVKVRYEILMG